MKHRWLWAWLEQIGIMLAVGALVALADGLGPLARGVALWGVAPLAGLLTSCHAVRRGLNNYAAWIAPALCLWGTNLLIWGYSPPAGPALLTAFTSLMGAAAGAVLNEREQKDGHKRSR